MRINVPDATEELIITKVVVEKKQKNDFHTIILHTKGQDNPAPGIITLAEMDLVRLETALLEFKVNTGSSK